jgi:hypothetical protein
MPTPASQMALDGLRDLTTLKWYVIPLLAIVFYIYTVEIQKARRSGNWDAIYAGLTLFGYFHFYVAIIIILSLKTHRSKIIAVGSLYTIAVLMNVYGMGIMGWKY